MSRLELLGELVIGYDELIELALLRVLELVEERMVVDEVVVVDV